MVEELKVGGVNQRVQLVQRVAMPTLVERQRFVFVKVVSQGVFDAAELEYRRWKRAVLGVGERGAEARIREDNNRGDQHYRNCKASLAHALAR
ncbi:MAG: hypothetical protein RIK87_00190 [Fuerstiella sp.]